MVNDRRTVAIVESIEEISDLPPRTANAADRVAAPHAASPPHDSRDAASNGQLTVRRLKTSEELASLSDDWNRLAQDLPFRRWDWLTTWWRHYGHPAAELFVLAVENGDGLIGIAPWYVEKSLTKGRVVQFLGSGEVCSDYLTILSAPGCEPDVADAVAAWLDGAGRAAWDMIELIGAESHDPAILALTHRMAASGFTIHQRPGLNCWRVALPARWDEFLASLNAKRRAKVGQATRKHLDTHRAIVHELTDPADFDRRFEMFVDLHQRRHKRLGHAGCFASSRFAAFHREIGRRLCELRKLRLVWTEIDGRPVAADYSFLGGQTIYCYQMGMAPDIGGVSPGWLNMIASLRRAIESGYRDFDYLRGDEPYKLSWGARPSATTETRIVARRPSARLRHSAWLTKMKVRHWLKRGFHLTRRITKVAD